MRPHRRAGPALARVVGALVVCMMLGLPGPAQAATFATGGSVTTWYNEITGESSNWSAVYGDNIGGNRWGDPAVNSYPLGFRLPADALAANMSFDVTPTFGYKWFEEFFKSQGDFNRQGAIHNRTYSQFDLRYSLVGASPFAFPDPANPLDVLNATGPVGSVAVGDFDNDTVLDLAVLTSSAVYVHFQGPSNFSRNVSFAISGTPIEVAAADLNGDGLTDIVAAARTATNLIQVYPIVQVAGGGLRSEGAQTVMTGALQAPVDMVVGDLSGDGRPEVAFLFQNRTVRWAEQFGGKNVDTWLTDVYSVDRTSANFGPRLNAMAMSPANCSAVIAAGQLNGAINIIVQSSMSTFATMSNNHTQVNGLAYSKDCNYLASVGQEGGLVVWVATTNSRAGGVLAHNGAVFAVAFAPNGSRVATGGTDGQLKIWDISPLPSPIVNEFNVTEPNGSILALEYSPDGSMLAVGTSNGTIDLYETASFTMVGSIAGHTETLRSLAFNPSGALLASGSSDDTLKVWDWANGSLLYNFTGATNDVIQVRFSPNGSFLGSASIDGFMRVYRTDTWQRFDAIDRTQPFYGFDFGQTDDALYGLAGATGNPSNIRVWNKARLIPITGWQTRQEFSVLGVEYGPGSSTIASASEDGTVVIINATTGARVASLIPRVGTANAVSYSPSGATLATAGADGTVQVYSTSNYSLVTNLTLAGNVTTVRFSPDGSLLAAGSSTGNVSVWSTSTWAQSQLFNASNQTIAALAFDPTSSKVVVGVQAAAAGNVRVYGALNGTLLMSMSNISYPVRAVDWSPDGSTIAAGGNGTNLYMWSATTGALRSSQVAHANFITAIAFSPDSLKVATGGYDRNVYTWSVQTGLLLQQVSSLPPSSNEVRTIDWSANGTRVVVGWNDYRFPVSRQAQVGGSLNAWGMAIGDVDPGYLGSELVFITSNNAAGYVHVMPFNGGNPVVPTYTTTTSSQSNYGGATKIAIGDIDGDGGRDDVVVVSPTAGNSVVAFQQHNASSAWNPVTSTIFMSQGANSVITGDVSDDGYDDILITAYDPTTNPPTNLLMVLVYDPGTTQPSNAHYQTISRYGLPAGANSPSYVAIGDLDRDGLTDAVTANGADRSVYVFHQLDELRGSYISPPLFDLQLAGLPIVSAYLEYDDVQSPPNTTVTYFLSVNNGITWTPVVRNQTVNFSSTAGTQLRYRVDFYSDRAGVSAYVQQLWAHYLVQSVGKDPLIDVGNDGIIDWNVTGTITTKTRVTIPGDVVNRYVATHLYLKDGNNTVEVPMIVRWTRPGGYNFTNLSVPYNSRPPAPTLIAPGPGSYAPAQPNLTVTSFDPDGEPLKYHVQVSLTPDFAAIVADYDQNISNIDWGCFVCLPGNPANKFVADADRLESGKTYYWRAQVWDGQQLSAWSVVWNFTVDDQPPEGAASSAPYSTVLSFTVTWTAADAVNGSGLASHPYDVQYKDGINGTWTDWFINTNQTSAIFTNASNGHMYCFRMRASDIAGNQQLYLTSLRGDTCTVVDTDRPSATMEPLDEYQQNAAFIVRWLGDDGPGGSGVAGFDVEYKENNGSWVDGPQSFPGTQWTFVADNDAEYCFRVVPRDRAGNIGNPATPVCTQVDTSAPAVSVIIPDTTNNLTLINVSMAANDPQTGVVGYEYCVGTAAASCDVLPPVAVPSPVSRITGLHLLNDATYFVNVRARNGAGAWSPWSASNPMKVVIPGPVTTLSYPTGIWTTLNVTLGIRIEDPLGFDIVAGDLQYRRAAYRNNSIQTWDDWRTVPVQPGSQDYLFEPLLRGYAYEFKYRARNEVGSWGGYDGNGTLIVNQLPVAATGGDRRIKLGDTVHLDASATLDYDGARDDLTFTWESDDGRTIGGPTGSLSFDTPGVHRIVLRVNDTHEDAIAEIFVFVEEPPPVQYLPGFEGVLALVGLLAVATLLAGRRRRE